MDFSDVKGYFSSQNLLMVGGAVAGYFVGSWLANYISGKVGGTYKTIVGVLAGLGVGAVMYAIGRSQAPDSSLKPLMYGMAIAAPLAGFIPIIGQYINKASASGLIPNNVSVPISISKVQ